MIVPNDFKKQWVTIEAAATAALRRVGASGHYILGQEVKAFEEELAQRWGLAHAVGVANGMDAVEIGLRCLGLRPGDRVLTTPLSAFATTLAITRVGAFPIFVDCDALGQIDLAHCREALARDASIRFLVPVHLFGFCVDLAELAQLKEEFDLKVVEDCAQAIGVSDDGAAVGTVGQVAATSFYPTKNLGAMGDGGALLTNDPDLAEQARALRNYGQSAQYQHVELGLNSRLDELQAAILRDAFLPRLENWTKHRQRTAQTYLDSIDNSLLQPLKPNKGMTPVWHLFPILVPPDSRTHFRDHMHSMGVATGVHYPTLIPHQSALRPKGSFEIASDLTTALKIADREVSLPIHPFLEEDEIARVIEACNSWKGPGKVASF